MDYGILSVVPAVLAIALAILTKNIVVSLVVAVFAGSTILCGWNPITGFLEVTHTHIFAALSEPSNMQALFMMTIAISASSPRTASLLDSDFMG